MVTQRKRVSELNVHIDMKKFENVLVQRIKSNPIMKVRCNKPKEERLKVHLIRKKTKYEYSEILFSRELVKYGYNEWIQIQDIITKHKGIHTEELKLALQQMINKLKRLNLVPSVGPSQPFTSTTTPKQRKSKKFKFLLPFGTVYTNKRFPVSVESIQHLIIREPEHDILYLDEQNHMCFECTEDLHSTPTKHLFHLCLECMGHEEVEQDYHWLISLEQSKCIEEFKGENF